MKKKVLFTSTNYMAYKFLSPHISNLIEYGYEVELACSRVNGYDELYSGTLDERIMVHNVRLQRSPFRFSNLLGLLDMWRIIKYGNYDLVCTNEPVMGVVTRVCTIFRRRKGLKVLYTAHGFHFYKGASIIRWIIYYPVEKLLSKYTDVLITMNHEDYALAVNKLKANRNVNIPGIGVDISKINSASVNFDKKRSEIGVPSDGVLLLSVGVLEPRKNHEVIIKALSNIKDKNVYYVICGMGKLENYLKRLCVRLQLEKQVLFLGHRRDINEIYKIADIFVFPSLQEGLSVALMEAMSVGLPCIVSSIRGNTDLIDANGGYLNDSLDSHGFVESIRMLIENKELRGNMGKHNQEVVWKYDLENVKKILLNLYLEMLDDKRISKFYEF